jgi:hypothetical protein
MILEVGALKSSFPSREVLGAQAPLTETDVKLDAVDIGKELERVKWLLWLSSVEIKPATKGRNDPASEFRVKVG